MGTYLNSRKVSKIEYSDTCLRYDQFFIDLIEGCASELCAGVMYCESSGTGTIEISDIEKLKELAENLSIETLKNLIDGDDLPFDTREEADEWIEDTQEFLLECVRNSKNTNGVAIIDFF